MSKIAAGIIGGAGYTAGELIRILINHPNVRIDFVHSSSHADTAVCAVHSGLVGECDLHFTGQLPLTGIDVLFLCSAHGESRKFLDENPLSTHVKIIDLSTDFRQKESGNPFVYGLPELNRAAIEKADKIANPGCFATAIQLALLPLASENLLHAEIHANAITGSTGAGVKPSTTSHFSWRNNNISVYNAFEHQHLAEIVQSLFQLQNNFAGGLNFIPVRGNFTRGIFATTYTDCPLTIEEAGTLYKNFYQNAPFTFVCDQNPDLKQVVNTNKALIFLEKHGNKLLIVSVIDNLLKGASGQAVQNMNLMFGFNEKTGLNFKAAGF
jgi:N-acetyl-gamma-glutamyl-phosphate reductase